MPCLKPLRCVKTSEGKISFDKNVIGENTVIDCGQCLSCRIGRQREWAVRCYHESLMNEANCFLTLTYADESLPFDRSLRKGDWQKFARSLRKRIGRFRYFMCGEYGDLTHRPHYHSIIFGYDFRNDRKYLTTRNGYKVYTSPFLEEVWPHGLHEIGEFTEDAASYVAGYVLKKQTGLAGQKKYTRLDDFGEEYDVEPEFGLMSLKPGIGYDFAQKYWQDMYPHDHVIFKGKPYPVPEYYRRIIAEKYPDYVSEAKEKRVEKAQELGKRLTPQLRRAHHSTLKAKLGMRRHSNPKETS